ncbi:MAG TPA: hypothetical protein VEI01_05150 [Terriglobales bacterium]|nr:hypothetical protein [Terriglobales bacterium]
MPTSHRAQRTDTAQSGIARDDLAHLAIAGITTPLLSTLLTDMANRGLGSWQLRHNKWLLSSVFKWAIMTGRATHNPVRDSGWLKRMPRRPQPPVYTLDEVQQMLSVLDGGAALSVALAFYGGLRPAEIMGLQWQDYDGQYLHVKRSIWRNTVNEDCKTEGSRASVPVVEPLRSMLDIRRQTQGYILANRAGNPLSLNSLNNRVIRPTMRKHGISWAGFYPARRGVASLIADTSNPLLATGLLRQANPGVTLKHYVRANPDSVRNALTAAVG